MGVCDQGLREREREGERKRERDRGRETETEREINYKFCYSQDLGGELRYLSRLVALVYFH